MTTTILLDDEVHIPLIIKRTELKKKKINITIKELVKDIILQSIENYQYKGLNKIDNKE